MEIWRPDGSVIRRFLSTEGLSPGLTAGTFATGLVVHVAADDPVGTYQVTVAQQSTFVGNSFTVSAEPDTTRRLILPILRAAPGERVPVGIAGMPPGLAVELHLYRQDGLPGGEGASTASYVRTLPAVTTNAEGLAEVALETRPDDPPGTYFLWSPSLEREGAWYRVTLEPWPPYPGTPLTAGAAGDAVRLVRQRLFMLEYTEVGSPASVFNDGEARFDSSTEAAVRLFQQDQGLSVTGAVDQATWARLFSALPWRRS